MTVSSPTVQSILLRIAPPTKQVSAGETIVSSQRKHAMWPVAMNTYNDAKLTSRKKC